MIDFSKGGSGSAEADEEVWLWVLILLAGPLWRLPHRLKIKPRAQFRPGWDDILI
jgi:hypothetical protein